MLLNTPFRLVPSPLTTAMMATDMPAAINPYSIAVAHITETAINPIQIERRDSQPSSTGIKNSGRQGQLDGRYRPAFGDVLIVLKHPRPTYKITLNLVALFPSK